MQFAPFERQTIHRKTCVPRHEFARGSLSLCLAESPLGISLGYRTACCAGSPVVPQLRWYHSVDVRLHRVLVRKHQRPLSRFFFEVLSPTRELKPRIERLVRPDVVDTYLPTT